MLALVEILLFLLLPPVALVLARRYRAVQAIGPVLVCYIFGVLLGNQPWLSIDPKATEVASGLSIALAIPLMVFSLDIRGWLRLARSTLISFGLAVLAVLLVAAAGGLLFGSRVEGSPQIAGMLVGVYTGGTPNMAAIGFALGVDSEVFGMLNVADMMLGAIYLVFLFTLAARVFGRLLPPFVSRSDRSRGAEPAGAPDRRLPVQESASIGKPGGAEPAGTPSGPASWRSGAVAMGLALLLVALAAGVYLVAPAGFEVPFAILAITTLAVAASLSPRIRNLPGTYGLGQYFLLVFCVAIGAQAEFVKLLSTSLDLILFAVLVMYGAIGVHLLLAVLLRIDRDTLIITSTAAIFGPAFVVPVAEAIHNREIVLSGIATGLVGYSVANYLGMGLAWLLG